MDGVYDPASIIFNDKYNIFFLPMCRDVQMVRKRGLLLAKTVKNGIFNKRLEQKLWNQCIYYVWIQIRLICEKIIGT